MASSRGATFCLAVGAAAILGAALGVAAGGQAAQACGRDCGGRGAYAPAPVYSAPPVYSYTCVYGGCTNRLRFYTTRVDIFRGPRWGYAAAYYNSPRRGGHCGRRGACGRAYLTGPIVPVSGPIGRRW